jgi:hypothetical protein
VLSGASGKLRVERVTVGVPSGESGGLWIVQPDGTGPMFNTFEQKGDTTAAAGLTFDVGNHLGSRPLLSGSRMQSLREPLKALRRSPSIYRVTPPHQYSNFVLQGPCFYQDFSRTYIVTSELDAYLTEVSGKSAREKPKFKAKVPRRKAPAPPGDFPARRPTVGPMISGRSMRDERLYGVSATKGEARYEGSAPEMIPASALLGAEGRADTSPTIPWIPGADAFPSLGSAADRTGRLRFRNLFHPHVSEFIRRLNHGGVDELLSLDTQALVNDIPGNRFAAEYLPTTNVIKPYPEEDVDFGEGAYALHNRELFFHAPALMADVCEAAGLPEEAERHLRYILDLTAGAGAGPGTSAATFWQYLPFRKRIPETIQELLKALSDPGPDPATLALKATATTQIAAWEKDPFNPYLIGRMRHGAMQKYIAIRWMQHLILRADMLLRSDRPEPINEAVQLLVMASNLAGPKAEQIPPRTRRTPESYNSLKGKLDRFSNALVLLENEFPFTSGLPAPSGAPGGGLLGMSEALYFCVPANDLLDTLRDTIADRLFKIRHSMNIEGVLRDLPMYEPPYDPAVFVAARASGLSLASALSEHNAPLPHDSFAVCLDRAERAVEDVRRLGEEQKGILEALDGERLNVRRARQDVALLREHMRQVKLRQVDEAKARIAVLQESDKLLSNVRIPYFMRQLGLSEEPASNTTASASVLQNKSELARVGAVEAARAALSDASQYDLAAKMASALPNVTSGTSGSTGTPVLTTYFGGQMVALGLGAFAQMKSHEASDALHQSTLAQIRAEVERRAEQWALELTSAVQERENVGRQLLQAQIGLELTQFQLTAHDRETEFAEDRLDFLENKPTAVPHHEWLHQEKSLLLAQMYQVAFDECKCAQQVYRFNTGDQLTTFVEFGAFDKTHHGLLAGERLGLALRKMSRAYRDQHRYENELSKPVSLALHDPMALIALKATGACEFALTEQLFDADFPGDVMRRLRRVSITIPCVTGPYTTVNATLTLLNSRTRMSNALDGGYAERPNDPRFAYHQGIMRSIATSSGREDAGTFKDGMDGHPGRFEGYGAICRLRLQLPHDTNAIDPIAVPDVILHVDYSSRPGGAVLVEAARKASIQPKIENAARLFSMRHEFAGSWHRALQPADPTATDQVFETDLQADHFAFGVRRRGPKAVALTILLQIDDVAAYQAGVALQAEIVLTPLLDSGAPSGPPVTQVATLQSIPTRLDGLPMARVALAAKVPARLQVRVKSADVGVIASRFVQDVGTGPNLRHRLNAQTVRDLDVLVTYDTAV